MKRNQWIRRRSKYGAMPAPGVIREIAGRRFDSKQERNRATDLVILQRAGMIRNLEFQPVVHLTRARIAYRADFRYDDQFDGKWRPVYEDSKGMVTDRFRIIRALWEYYGPTPLHITAPGKRTETVYPKQQQEDR